MIGGTMDPSPAVPLQTGSLTREQIALMLTHLPIDITFVDEGNDVRFYSGGNAAEFWIPLQTGTDPPRLIHIRFFAVRDSRGRFRGTIEVTQDISEIRNLATTAKRRAHCSRP
jgi:DUF438 domain-containing protein